MVMTVRERVASSLLNDICEVLFKIHHPHSGRVMESTIQFLPDDQFNALSSIVVGHDQDPLVHMLASAVVVRLAGKQNIEFSQDDMTPYFHAVRNFILLVNCEHMRRKGHMHYLWNEDFFIPADEEKIMTLTESGKGVAHKLMLQQFEGKYKN
jgi:hypothetical protein